MRKAALFAWGAGIACASAACTSILGDFNVSPAAGDGGAGGGGGGGAVDAGDAAPPLPLLTDAVEVSAGGAHTCAVRASGSVACWGSNPSGEIGQPVNVTPQSSRPLTVLGVANVKTVVAGFGHTCALDKSGNVWCWGSNLHGQLGLGTLDVQPTPHPVPTQVLLDSGGTKLTGVTALAVRADYTCALVGNPGEIFCWGDNGSKQCGDPGAGQDELPHQVASLGVPVNALGPGAQHACAIYLAGGADGGAGQGPPTLECWGTEQHGELGDGQPSNQTATPVGVTIANFTPGQVWGGLDHSCAVGAQSGAFCWGNNDKGQIGSATVPPAPATAPVPLQGGQNLTTLSLGDSFTCGLTASGGVLCAGRNDLEQLGTGASNTTPNPTLGAVTGVTGAKSISAGGSHACAVIASAAGSGGTVTCWGADGVGQLGDGAPPHGPSAPVQVVAPPN